jgi:hypothetical protein
MADCLVNSKTNYNIIDKCLNICLRLVWWLLSAHFIFILFLPFPFGSSLCCSLNLCCYISLNLCCYMNLWCSMIRFCTILRLCTEVYCSLNMCSNIMCIWLWDNLCTDLSRNSISGQPTNIERRHQQQPPSRLLRLPRSSSSSRKALFSTFQFLRRILL